MDRATQMREAEFLPYFVDSNVLIGFYFFCGDHWGTQAKKVIEKPEVKHTSTTVWHECFGDGGAGRCRTVFSEIKSEFHSAISFLTKDQYSPTELYYVAVDDNWKIREIIEELVGKYQNDVKEMVRKIRKAEWRYEVDCEDRLNQLNKSSILEVHNRDMNYPNTQRILDSAIDDPSDVTILLDAHHVGVIISGLDFVTGDYEHIVQQKHISNVTYLDSI